MIYSSIFTIEESNSGFNLYVHADTVRGNTIKIKHTSLSKSFFTNTSSSTKATKSTKSISLFQTEPQMCCLFVVVITFIGSVNYKMQETS